jgi:predicted dehydrogenase
LDSVAITTPNHTHSSLIALGIQNGLNVFCEKPLVNAISEAFRIRKTLEDSRLVLMVGFQFRYSELYKELKALVDDERFGKVLRVRVCHYLDIVEHVNESSWLKWSKKSGGGVVFNVGIHSINLILSLFGDLSRISAGFRQSTLFPGLGEDTANFELKFEAGVYAKFSISYLKGPSSNREFKIILFCEKASIICDFNENVVLVKEKKCGKVSCKYFSEQDSDRIYEELSHFAYCIKNRHKPDTDIDDYIKTASVIQALYEAGNSEKTRSPRWNAYEKI